MEVKALQPFGAVVYAGSGEQSLMSLAPEQIAAWLDQYCLLVLRGYQAMVDGEYTAFARQFGPLLQWEFGEVLELKIQTDPANHIFSAGRVELHWDGAYVNDKPHYNLFQCLAGSDRDAGGETLFVNTVDVLNRASDEQRAYWDSVVIDYRTEKKAHYGGSISQTLCAENPYHQQNVIRYIEAFNEDNEKINPVTASVRGLSQSQSDRFLREFTLRLYENDVMYRHCWQTGDYLIADNSRLLHGRARFTDSKARRYIKRINIL